METRQTSIDCYNQIKAQGLLSKRRFEVYEAIFNSAPCTGAEAVMGRINSKNVYSQSRARFTELRDMGVIYEKGIKKCSITGRKVIEYDLTDRLPIDRKVTIVTKKQRVANTLYALNELHKNRIASTSEEWDNLENLIKSI
jgi:hypothetical protein